MKKISVTHPHFRASRQTIVCLVMALVTLFVFWQVKDHGFIALDDNVYVTDNTYVLQGLSLANLKWALTTSYTGYWHPLTWLSHMLDVQLFGPKAGWHHLMNVFFHIINALLLFLILHRATKLLWQSAFVAALFALHPLHVESVAWVAERKDVLSTLFWMLSLGSYVYYVEHPGYRRYLFVLCFFALGLMSKPMVVTFPFILLLLDYWPLGRFQPAKKDRGDSHNPVSPGKPARKKQRTANASGQNAVPEKGHAGHSSQGPGIRALIMEKIPLFLFAVLSSAITLVNQQGGSSLQDVSADIRITNAIVSCGKYLGKTLWPLDLAVFYPYPPVLPFWQVLGAALMLLAATFLVVRETKHHPYLGVGWLWFLGMLVPVIGLVKVGSQAMADRYTYLPLIGIFIMIAWGVPDCLKNWKQRTIALGMLSGIAILACIVVTWMQLQHWKDSETLFRHTLKVTTGNFVIHNNLGTVLSAQGEVDDAITHYRTALSINPKYEDAWFNLGNACVKSGQTAMAVEAYQQALHMNPKHSEAWNHLGIAYAKSGQTDEAIKAFRETLHVNPEHGEASFNLGNAYQKSGQTALAVEAYQQALSINPTYTEAWNNLGLAYAKSGQTDEAIKAFRKALRINPEYAKAWFGLGIIYLESGQNERAREVHERLKAVDPAAADEFLRILPRL